MSVDLDALRTLAEQATPGPWFSDATDETESVPHFVIDGVPWELGLTRRNADFIAACSPEVVLALVEAVEALSVYADPRNWGISRDDLNYRVVSWIGPGADKAGLPDAMETARAALAPFVRASTEANA